MKLNIGAGESKLEGYINIDCDPGRKPDLCTDIRYSVLPYDDNSVEKIIMFHTIEHIEKRFHVFILSEFNRVLKMDGRLLLSFPEFKMCAENLISNHLGDSGFWEATIFGRQASKSDYHVCAMDSEKLRQSLIELGFSNIIISCEDNFPYYTIISGQKVRHALGREEVIRQEVFQGQE